MRKRVTRFYHIASFGGIFPASRTNGRQRWAQEWVVSCYVILSKGARFVKNRFYYQLPFQPLFPFWLCFAHLLFKYSLKHHNETVSLGHTAVSPHTVLHTNFSMRCSNSRGGEGVARRPCIPIPLKVSHKKIQFLRPNSNQKSDGSRFSPRWGCQLSRGRQHTILPNFPKNCMKLKEFGP